MVNARAKAVPLLYHFEAQQEPTRCASYAEPSPLRYSLSGSSPRAPCPRGLSTALSQSPNAPDGVERIEGPGQLTGTVTGSILRATRTTAAEIPSAFILRLAEDGSIRGLRSANRGPFRLYAVAAAPAGVGAPCADAAPPALGCGSIIHGITFGFDSAEIR